MRFTRTRREVGHGALARAGHLIPVLPAKEASLSGCGSSRSGLSSNGSTSMGIGLRQHLALNGCRVAAQGSRKRRAVPSGPESRRVNEVRIILTDIQGNRDFRREHGPQGGGNRRRHHRSCRWNMIKSGSGRVKNHPADRRHQGPAARVHILEKMLEAIEKPREILSAAMPRACSAPHRSRADRHGESAPWAHDQGHHPERTHQESGFIEMAARHASPATTRACRRGSPAESSRG